MTRAVHRGDLSPGIMWPHTLPNNVDSGKGETPSKELANLSQGADAAGEAASPPLRKLM